jgi:ABC-type nitrate/sulfonate/bicarbonate transport system substrate-binding protein
MADNRFSRRGALKLGGMAMLAGTSSLVTSFSARGALAPINVITSNSTLTNTLFNILTAQKYLDEFGVSIDTLNVADGSKTVPALLSGGSDLCVINGLGLAMASIAKGAAMKLVGTNCLSPQAAIYSAKPDVKTVKDLEGKIVGVNALGALPHQMMVTLMQKEGVDVSKVSFRNVGSNTDIFRAVAAGTVDAGPSGIDVYYEVDQYGVHVLSDGNLWAELPDFTYQGAYASDVAIATKRDGLVRVLAAFIKLFRFIQSPDSKDAFAQARERATGKNEAKAAADAWNFIQKYKPYTTDLSFSEERVNYLQKLNINFSAQDSIMPYNKMTDMSLAADALKLVGA